MRHSSRVARAPGEVAQGGSGRHHHRRAPEEPVPSDPNSTMGQDAPVAAGTLDDPNNKGELGKKWSDLFK